MAFKYKNFAYGNYKESDRVKNDYNNLKQNNKNRPAAWNGGQYGKSMNDAMNKVLNREAFSYDLNGDALYQQYKNQYINQGRQAMMDTIGQASALTGGYDNSYAQTVGQQTYNGYLGQLNDKIPELYQLALQKYQMDGDQLMQNYGMLADQYNSEYGRYRDSVADWQDQRDYLYNLYNNDRSFDYGKYSDNRDFAYNRYSDNRNLAYQDYRNGIADQQWQQQQDYQKQRDKKADEQWQKEFDAAQAARAAASSSGGDKKSSTEFDKNGISETRREDKNTGGISASAWEMTKNNVATNLRNGNFGNVDKYMEQIAPSLSKKQWNELSEMLNKYGYNTKKY